MDYITWAGRASGMSDVTVEAINESKDRRLKTKRMKRNKKRKLIFSIAKRLLDDGTVV